MNQQALNLQSEGQLAMISGLQIGDDQKDVIRTLVGFQHMVLSSGLHATQFQNLQVPSPLSKVDTSINCLFTSSNHPYVLQRLVVSPLGPVHVTNLAPFNRILFLRGNVQVEMITQGNAPAPYNNLDLDKIITQITSVTGLTSCSCEACRSSSNLQGILVQSVANNVIGFATICETHSINRAAAPRMATLSSGSQIFFIQ